MSAIYIDGVFYRRSRESGSVAADRIARMFASVGRYPVILVRAIGRTI